MLCDKCRKEIRRGKLGDIEADNRLLVLHQLRDKMYSDLKEMGISVPSLKE